jgi:hypothetical protein
MSVVTEAPIVPESRGITKSQVQKLHGALNRRVVLKHREDWCDWAREYYSEEEPKTIREFLTAYAFSNEVGEWNDLGASIDVILADDFYQGLFEDMNNEVVDSEPPFLTSEFFLTVGDWLDVE